MGTNSGTQTDGVAGLHAAVACNDLSKIRALVSAGVDPSVVDQSTGISPLHVAILAGATDALRVLLQLGADPNFIPSVGTTRGWSGLHATQGAVSFDRLLTASPLSYAARYGDHEAAEALLEAGVDPNAVAENSWLEGSGLPGRPPIFVAAEGGADRVLRALVAHGANVNVKDDGGSTPLRYALHRAEAVRVLLDAGADADARPRGGDTPLFLVLRAGGPIEVVELLIARGADVNATRDDATGVSVLHWAVAQRATGNLQGELRAFEELLRAGASTRARTRSEWEHRWGAILPAGSTPRELALAIGDKELAALLA